MSEASSSVAHIDPCRIPYRSDASKQLGEDLREQLKQLGSAMRTVPVRSGRWAVRVFQLGLTPGRDWWCCEWMVGIPWQAVTLYTPPRALAVEARHAVDEVRRTLDRGLSVEAMWADPDAWVEHRFENINRRWFVGYGNGNSGYADDPSWWLERARLVNELPDHVRRAAIALCAGDWNGTTTELVEAAKTITG